MKISCNIALLVCLFFYVHTKAIAEEKLTQNTVKLSESWYLVIDKNAGKCMTSLCNTNACSIKSQECNGSINQRWSFVPYEDGNFAVKNLASGKVLDVRGGTGSVSNGDICHLWEYLGAMNQRWAIEGTGIGYVRIRAAHSSKCLDSWEGNMTQFECRDVPQQRFTLMLIEIR